MSPRDTPYFCMSIPVPHLWESISRTCLKLNRLIIRPNFQCLTHCG